MQEAELEKATGLLSRFKNDHMTKLLDLLDIPRSELKDKVSCPSAFSVCLTSIHALDLKYDLQQHWQNRMKLFNTYHC